MPSAYTQNFYHTVFSTKHRAMLINPDLEKHFYPFIGGILRDLRCTLLPVNGMPDHVHLLVRYRADLSHSEMLQQIKGRSSKWINETWPQRRRFSWQAGYGGFTVSKSAVSQVKTYIARQKEHHQRMDFKTEFLDLLRRHGIEFHEDDVFEGASSALRAGKKGGPAFQRLKASGNGRAPYGRGICSVPTPRVDNPPGHKGRMACAHSTQREHALCPVQAWPSVVQPCPSTASLDIRSVQPHHLLHPSGRARHGHSAG